MSRNNICDELILTAALQSFADFIVFYVWHKNWGVFRNCSIRNLQQKTYLTFRATVFWYISVGAGKVLGVRRIFAQISPNLPEKLLGHFLCEYFLMKTVFCFDLQTNVFMWFWAPIFSNQSTFGSIFARIFREFARIFKGLRSFSQILPKFLRILTGFSRFLPRFSPNLNCWGRACTPASYTTPLLWEHSECRKKNKNSLPRTGEFFVKASSMWYMILIV